MKGKKRLDKSGSQRSADQASTSISMSKKTLISAKEAAMRERRSLSNWLEIMIDKQLGIGSESTPANLIPPLSIKSPPLDAPETKSSHFSGE